MVTSGLPCAASPSPNACVLLEFHRFQDYAVLLISNVDSLCTRYGWSDHQKWSEALNHIHHAAEAWQKYEGIWQQSLQEWSAKFIAAFGPLPNVSNCSDHIFNMDKPSERHHTDVPAPRQNVSGTTLAQRHSRARVHHLK